MWRIIAFIGLCIGGVFVYTQHPVSWRHHKVFRFVIPILHLLGLAALFILFFLFPKIPDGGWKSLILFIETVYFIMVCHMAIFYGIRLAVYLVALWRKKSLAEKMKRREKSFSAIFLTLTLAFAIFGFVRIDQIRLTTFDIDLTRGEASKGSFRAAVIGDTHVGAGATHEVLDQMVENINSMDVDVVFFVGDASDSCSSTSDLAYLRDSLKKIKSRWGIYYISGNHDKETDEAISPWLTDAGVILIEDTTAKLPNGVVLAGHSDGTETTLADILTENGVVKEDTVICLQHRPQKLAAIQDDCDLVVSGHTHGPRWPWALITQYINFDNPAGVKVFGEMTSFTTMGVSAWGIHFKCPSYSETALLNIVY